MTAKGRGGKMLLRDKSDSCGVCCSNYFLSFRAHLTFEERRGRGGLRTLDGNG